MKSTILIVLAFMVVAGAAFAGTAEGEKEIGGLVAYMSPDEGDDTTFAQIFGGYFVTDQWQAKLAFSAFSIEGDISGTIGGGADYHFSIENPDIVPYAGAVLTTSYGDVDSGTQIDLHVGAKMFVSEGTAFNASVSYFTGGDLDMMMALLGISVFL